MKDVLSKYISCKPLENKILESSPASLAKHRTKDAAVFQIIVKDMTGSLFLKDNQRFELSYLHALSIGECILN